MNVHSKTEFAELMDRAGLGIDEVAGLLGVSDRSIRRYIDGIGKRVDPLKLDKLKQVASQRCNRPVGHDGFRFIDLFAGIGGCGCPLRR